ncbi:flavodoxin family protein [Salinispira pacifica]
MKIIGVLSSENRRGNGAALLRELLSGAKAHGAQTVQLNLADLHLEFCQGCLGCMARGRCVQPDDFEKVRDLLVAADGIVLSTPVFAGAPCARLKNFIDRLGLYEYMTGSVYAGKYFAAIATAKSFGAEKTVGYLADVAEGGLFGHAHVSGLLPVILRSGTTAEEEPRLLERAYRLGEKMVIDWERRRRVRPRHPLTRFVTDRFVRPRVARAIADNHENGMEAVYASLRERQLVR